MSFRDAFLASESPRGRIVGAFLVYLALVVLAGLLGALTGWSGWLVLAILVWIIGTAIVYFRLQRRR